MRMVKLMSRRKLPIGIQSFAKMREEESYSIDKTGFIARLIEQGSFYFLSRPRRFGKSLLIDTIGELFAGNAPLFRALAIHPDRDKESFGDKESFFGVGGAMSVSGFGGQAVGARRAGRVPGAG